MYQLDSSHIWHVAKSGNNSNSGHAGQYPVNLANDAKLTIGAAVTAAANGDTIIIWPGVYVETVNLDAADKGLSLIGTHRDLCKIAPAADDAIIIEDNTQLHNLSFITEVANKRGIEGISKNNIIINNCYAYGPYDGIYLVTCSNIRLTNSYFKGTYDGANIGNKGLFIDGCIFETDGAFTSVPVTALLLGECAEDDFGVLVRNTIARAVRVVTSTRPCYAIKRNKGKVLIDNCDLIAVNKTDATGDAYALLGGFTTIKSIEGVINNTRFFSASNGGTALDIGLLKDSKVALSNCLYDRSKVSLGGTSSIIDLSDANGRVDVAKIEGTDATNAINATKAAKVLLNKAVQNKLTGTIDYYDDDGETVILTHTPAEGESAIERNPS